MHVDRVREEYKSGLGGENDPIDRQEANQNREVIRDQLNLVADLDTGLESPQNQGTNMESPNNMEVISSSLGILNLAKDTQTALFQEQLKEIDNELIKFDNVGVKGGEYGAGEFKIHPRPLAEQGLNGPGTLDLISNRVRIKEKGKRLGT